MTSQDKKILLKLRKHVDKIMELQEQLSDETKNFQSDDSPWGDQISAYVQPLVQMELKAKL